MKFTVKLVKDLLVGDKVYANRFSPNEATIGIDYLGTVVEIHNPSSCMGLIGYGISQSFITFDGLTDTIKHRTGFTELPILVGVDNVD